MTHPTLSRTSHRPWPLPRLPWIMAQTWKDVLFVHYRVAKGRVRPLVPTALELEEYDGSAWVSIVAFDMMVRPRLLPPVPGLSFFPELNVRTYVRADDKPGIWFFSLDAASRLAVGGARALLNLPYFVAKMSVRRRHGWVEYEHARRGGEVAFEARYRGLGGATEPVRGSLEHWLVERYCLYTVPLTGRLLREDIHHLPWPLASAEAEIQKNTLLAPFGIHPEDPPLLHYAARQDVAVYPPLGARTRPSPTGWRELLRAR